MDFTLSALCLCRYVLLVDFSCSSDSSTLVGRLACAEVWDDMASNVVQEELEEGELEDELGEVPAGELSSQVQTPC